MDSKTEEETAGLTANTKQSANVVDSSDNCADTDSLKHSKQPNKAANEQQSTSKLKTQKKSFKPPKRMPISLASMRQTSSLVVDELKQKEQEDCAACLDSKSCCVAWIILAVIVTGITFLVAIASIIAGWQISQIWETYDADMIAAQCPHGSYADFVHNGTNLGSHAEAVFVFGIVDFVLLLSQAICVFAYLYHDMVDMDTNVFNIMAGVRLFFLIVWLVYASFFFDATRVLNEDCDPDGSFYADMFSVLKWYIPILALEVFKAFVVGMTVCFTCCIMCCCV